MQGLQGVVEEVEKVSDDGQALDLQWQTTHCQDAVL